MAASPYVPADPKLPLKVGQSPTGILFTGGSNRRHVHHLASKGVSSAAGDSLRHPDAWYILNEIPTK